MPGRAIRGAMPRPRSQAMASAEWQALSARSLLGRLRRGPRRERMAGIALTSGCSAWLSWTLAAETPTASGTPCASDNTCSLLPGLPRSTGFGPVSDPLFSPAPTRRR